MNAKTKSSLTIGAIALVVGLVVGFFTGRHAAPIASGSHLPGSRAAATSPTRDAGRGPATWQDKELGDAETVSHNWSARLAEAFRRARPGEPTAEFATFVNEAIQTGEPYSAAHILSLIELMRPEDLSQALELFKHLTATGALPGSGQHSLLWQALWQRFGEVDPIAGFRAARELGDLKYPGLPLVQKHIFHGWAARDSLAAAQYFVSQPDIPNRQAAVQGITFEWARKDPQAAAKWIAENLEAPTRGAGFQGVAWALWDKHGFQTALDWWTRLSDQGDQSQVFNSLTTIANTNPSTSLDSRVAFVLEARRRGLRNAQLETRLASDFAQTDPVGGMNLLTQLSSSENPAAYPALGTLLSQWTQRDPQAASEWTASQQGQAWYDSAASSMAAAVVRSDASAAAEWARSIQDETLRKQVEQRLSQFAKRAQ